MRLRPASYPAAADLRQTHPSRPVTPTGEKVGLCGLWVAVGPCRAAGLGWGRAGLGSTPRHATPRQAPPHGQVSDVTSFPYMRGARRGAEIQIIFNSFTPLRHGYGSDNSTGACPERPGGVVVGTGRRQRGRGYIEDREGTLPPTGARVAHLNEELGTSTRARGGLWGPLGAGGHRRVVAEGDWWSAAVAGEVRGHSVLP